MLRPTPRSHLVRRVTGGGSGPIPVGGAGMGCHRCGGRRRRVTKFGSTRGGLAEDWSPALCCSLRPGCDPRRIPAPPPPPGLTLAAAEGPQGCVPNPSWRGEALAPRLCVRVALLVLFSPMRGFFSWGCFIGIPVIKTWCSLGALMWPAAWAGPSLFSPLSGVGFGP